MVVKEKSKKPRSLLRYRPRKKKILHFLLLIHTSGVKGEERKGLKGTAYGTKLSDQECLFFLYLLSKQVEARGVGG